MILEEIKKDIKEMADGYDLTSISQRGGFCTRLDSILDKYQTRLIEEYQELDNCTYVKIPKLAPDYKATWEESKEYFDKSISEFEYEFNKMQELEQTHLNKEVK